MSTNDNYTGPSGSAAPGTDPPGHAALLLVESLIHGLCEKKTISVEDAIEIVERAIDVQADQAEASDDGGATLWRSHAMLSEIVASLRMDGQDKPSPPRLVT